MDLDIVPIVFNIKPFHTDSVTRPNVKHRISSTTGSYVPSGAETPTVYYDPAQLPGGNPQLTAGAQNKLPIPRTVDEQADSAARKCIMYFGPGNNPRLSIGGRNQVAVDAGGKIHLIDDIDVFRNSVHKGTWNSVIKLADELRERKIKMGFFSSTPQGGECALQGLAVLGPRVLALFLLGRFLQAPIGAGGFFRDAACDYPAFVGIDRASAFPRNLISPILALALGTFAHWSSLFSFSQAVSLW